MSFVLFVLFSFSTPLLSVELYEEKKVSQILIEFESPEVGIPFDPKPVLSKLRTKVGDKFSQYTFDNDLKALSSEYDQIEPSLKVSDDRVLITIKVSPRPIIHQINFSGNVQYSTSTLQKELDIKPYTTFNLQEFNKAFNKLKDYYIKHGYFESQLSYTVVQIPNTNEADVNIEIKEGRSGRIKKILFEGFTKDEQAHLTTEMYLKKYNFVTSWITGKGIFRDEALDQDRMTILNYLQNKGYADASVDVELLTDETSDKMVIRIKADRGILYHFGSVEISGNTLLSNEELLKRSQVQPDGIFSPEKLREATQAIKDLYGQKGYIDASVQYEMNLKEDSPIFDISFSVEEGRPYKIGLIQIFGNHSTKNNVILRESLLVPGETFDSRKLKATQQRLEAIGYFKSVNVYAVRSQDDLGMGENYRDVYIEVDETTTGNIQLFLGFSSTDSVFGGLDLTERNFNIAGLTSALKGRMSALRGGGQYFHMRGTVGEKQNNALISWMNPYVYDSLWRLGVELSITNSDLTTDSLQSNTYGGSVFANYPLSTYWTGGFRQRLRHTKTIPESDQMKHQRSSNDDNTDEQIRDYKSYGQGFLSALSANVSYDSTDSASKPHRGWRSYLEGECAGLGGDYQFFKLSYLNSIYFPISKYSSFKLRGEFRFISLYGGKPNELKSVPYTERFFLGGEGTVRGYKPFGIGPKIPVIKKNKEGDSYVSFTHDPAGGRTSILLSAEYNYELLRMADVFFFFDAGSVSADEWDVNKPLRCSTGAGLRLEINRGTPIILGYAIPINPGDNKKQKFFFSMGGQF